MADGLDAHVHLFVPATRPDDPRTVLLLHGTGGNERDLLPLGRSIAPGAALLGVRGNVLERGMPRFFRRLAEGVFDLDDLRTRTHELCDFLEAASAAYGFRRDRLVAAGYSNGANIAAAALLLRPSALAAALLFHPMVPLVPEPLPDLAGKPVLVSAGRQDALVPPSGTERLVELLSAAGAAVTLLWQPGGHALVPSEASAARSWLESVTF